MHGTKRATAVGLLAILTAGCPSTDERLAEMAALHNQQQAEQNQSMAKQSDGVVQASRDLVQSDATARQELIAAQHNLNRELQAERSSLDRQHEQLADERRDIAKERRRDPIIATTIASIGLLLACMLPLAMAIVLVRKTHGDCGGDDDLSELLVMELASDRSLLSPPTTVAPQLPPRSLPGHKAQREVNDDESL